MKRCKDCKHWVQEEFITQLADDQRVCQAMYQKSNKYVKDDDQLAIAVCWSEGIGGELITKAEFGCVLFEDK